MWPFLACAVPPEPAPPTREARAREAVEQALRWMEDHADEPRSKLDVAIGLSAVAALLPTPTAEGLRDRLVPVHDRSGDPRRRLYDPAHRLAEPPPASVGADGRPNPNAALVEALHCPEWPLRSETLAAVCGPLRDGGGYGSTHAAWIVAEAVERGCVPRAETCAEAMVAELTGPWPPLAATLDRDLLCERVAFGLRAGAPPEAFDGAVDAILHAQGADGGFAVPAEGEPAWWAWHATLACAWGLAAWAAR